MRKLIITMVAIAFSLSAFSQIYKLEVHDEITVWCIKDYVFVKHNNDGFVQYMESHRRHYQTLRATTCDEYKEDM